MQNTRDENVQIKLSKACSDGDIVVVEDILEEVDINNRDYMGDTPLIYAMGIGALDIVRRLLEHPRIQLGKRVSFGFTALHEACLWNRVEIVRLLCQARSCGPGIVNMKNRDGDTALMIAVYWGYLDIVKEVDIEGTDFFTKDGYNGRTLIETARMRKNAKVLEYLIERNKVDNLQVISAHNVARYMKNKADVEALDIPETVRHFLARFVDDDDSLDTDDDGDDDDDKSLDLEDEDTIRSWFCE